MAKLIRMLVTLALTASIVGCGSKPSRDSGPVSETDGVQESAQSEQPTPDSSSHKQADPTLVRIELLPRVEGGRLVVEGKTNLPENARVKINVKFDRFYGGPNDTELTVDGQGRFTHAIENIEQFKGTRAWVRVDFEPTSEQPITVGEIFGPRGEKLKSELSGKDFLGNAYAYQFTYIDLNTGAVGPAPSARPPEFAPDPEITFADLSIRQEGREIFVTGKTNLLAGSELHVKYEADDWVLSGYDVTTYVMIDGSFNARLEVPERMGQVEVRVKLKYSISPGIVKGMAAELYGASGEKLRGKWVLSEGGAPYIQAELTYTVQ